MRLYKMAKMDGQLVKLNCGDDPEDDEIPEIEPVEPTKIKLSDEDGKPLPKQRFILQLPDGSQRSGVLDEDGCAELELAESGDIIFPDVNNPRQA